MKQKFSVDRIENGIAVCYDEDMKKYEFAEALVPLARGSLFEAELVDGTPQGVVYLEKETLETKKQMKSRLDNLFGRRAK
ncbi:MAG: DUF3006 domain-containing protein [Clostridia bacterium]|nr:DUF3006 domain-containing protein [Clostridia bacterium]